ncbi:MAG: restriction endonuclease subunit S [Gammaproteobacteria bacterium]|nr:restriction endonuclease subunit S [Gammaproteobacteria bacterium]
MKVVQPVPKLRFKQENGEEFPDWKIEKLGELADIFRGSGLRKSILDPSGQYPCILYGELYTLYSEVISKVHSRTYAQNKVKSAYGDILLPTSGETPEGVATASALLVSDVQIGGDIIVVRCTKSVNPILISYILNGSKRQISRLAAGASVSHIYPKDLKLIEITVPSIPAEQHKIACFLIAIDDRLDLLEQKMSLLLQYKQGLMQKLFNRELRFKDESGEEFPEWVKYKLGEISLVTKGSPIDSENKTKQGYPVIAGGKTSPYSYKFFTHENCITVSGSGAHAGHVAYHPYKFWGSDCSIVSGTNSNSVTLFVYYLMFFHQRKIYSLQIGGAQPHVYPKTLKSLTVSIPPNVNEQQKIANCLTAIDDKIELVNYQIEKTQSFKQGLLQQLFV